MYNRYQSVLDCLQDQLGSLFDFWNSGYFGLVIPEKESESEPNRKAQYWRIVWWRLVHLFNSQIRIIRRCFNTVTTIGLAKNVATGWNAALGCDERLNELVLDVDRGEYDGDGGE